MRAWSAGWKHSPHTKEFPRFLVHASGIRRCDSVEPIGSGITTLYLFTGREQRMQHEQGIPNLQIDMVRSPHLWTPPGQYILSPWTQSCNAVTATPFGVTTGILNMKSGRGWQPPWLGVRYLLPRCSPSPGSHPLSLCIAQATSQVVFSFDDLESKVDKSTA